MALKNYVFISYSSKENEFVKQLTNLFEINKIAYWKAPEMIAAGSNYAKEIPQAIRECSVFLMVVSAASQESIWVEKEVDTAICHRKRIIPVKIDDAPLNDMYRFYLNNVQMVHAVVENRLIMNLDVIRMVFEEALENGKDVSSVRGVEHQETVKSPDKRSNALRINKIPLECEFCGGAVVEQSRGVYKCVDCSRENYDDFQKIRNFLEKSGAAPIAVIARNTGVSYKTIEYFWNEEYLEIPKNLDIRISCAECGKPIRTGTLCEFCKGKKRSDINNKGVWHTKKW